MLGAGWVRDGAPKLSLLATLHGVAGKTAGVRVQAGRRPRRTHLVEVFQIGNDLSWVAVAKRPDEAALALEIKAVTHGAILNHAHGLEARSARIRVVAIGAAQALPEAVLGRESPGHLGHSIGFRQVQRVRKFEIALLQRISGKGEALDHWFVLDPLDNQRGSKLRVQRSEITGVG